MVRQTFGVLAVLFTVQACGGGEDPQVPTTLAVAGGSTVQMTGVVFTETAVAPQVQILDAKGKGIAGLRVRWQVGSNSGGVGNDSSTTDGAGIARSGGWTLGTVAGTQTLTASAAGVSPITFTAQAVAGPAANLVRVSPTTQQAVVNTNVPSPPSVRAEDVFGNVVSGVAVTFSVATGGGTMEGVQQTTNASGVATVGSWRLGTGVGQQIARATASNVPQASFSATALAGAATTLTKVTGDNQQGISGSSVAIRPTVRVTDEFGNPVGNVPVTFTPGNNSGTVTNGTVASDPATGNASVGSWILGSAPAQTLTATSSALPSQSVSFAATASQSLFNLEVRFVGDGGTPQIRQAFLDAAAKWRRMIVGRVHTFGVNVQAGETCGLSWTPAVNETITDLVIYARIGQIDQGGSGGLNTIARAGPCFLAPPSRLPVLGIMEFDEFDITAIVNAGTFGDVVLHEMGHVLGVGTLWNGFGRAFLVGAGSAAPNFTGPSALNEFSALTTVAFNGDPVPVEGNQFPVGTRDGHWRESVFGRELMQGFVKSGGMPLSRVTVASLRDLDYQVDLSAADPFTPPSPFQQGLDPFSGPAKLHLHDRMPAAPVMLKANGRP